MTALAVLTCFSCGTEKSKRGSSGTGGEAAGATGGNPGTGGHLPSGTGGAGGIPATGGSSQLGTGGANVDASADNTNADVSPQSDGGIDAVDSGPADGSSDVTGWNLSVPSCARSPQVDVRACVLAADGKLVTTGVDTMVTVTRVDDAMTVCDPIREGTNAVAFRRFAVESPGGTKWTVLVRIPDLPAAQVSAGQTLQMTIMASGVQGLGYTVVSQTVVFSRQGNLVLFASDQERGATFAGGPWKIPTTKYEALPNLSSWGLALSDGAAVCYSYIINCLDVTHRADVTWGGTARSVAVGETAQIGSLSFSLAEFEQTLSNGACEGGGDIRLGGFVAGP